jgi:hypothetical protein
VSSLKKTLRKIKKVTKKLGKKEKEVLLRGLQDYLHQGEMLLRRAAKAAGSKKSKGAGKAKRSGKSKQPPAAPMDTAAPMDETAGTQPPADA